MSPSRSGVTLKQPGGWAVLNLKGDFFFIILLFLFSLMLQRCWAGPDPYPSPGLCTHLSIFSLQ